MSAKLSILWIGGGATSAMVKSHRVSALLHCHERRSWKYVAIFVLLSRTMEYLPSRNVSINIYICRCLEVSFHRLRKWRGSLFNPVYVSVDEIFWPHLLTMNWPNSPYTEVKVIALLPNWLLSIAYLLPRATAGLLLAALFLSVLFSCSNDWPLTSRGDLANYST